MRVSRPAAILLAVLLLCSTFTALAAAPRAQKRGLILHDGVVLRAQPSPSAAPITLLWQQTQVVQLGSRAGWLHVRIWSSVEGWVPVAEVTYRTPWETISTYHAPSIKNVTHAAPPAVLVSRATVVTTATLFTRPGGAPTGTLKPGAVRVIAWQQDAAGHVWYRIGRGWAQASGVRLTTTSPPSVQAGGGPLWKRVAGKGMWLTLGTIAQSEPRAIIHAALHAGVTHLYLESAISPLGFHGRSSVGPLLDLAHVNHIVVIAWVYPYLYDIAADVALSRQVAAFKTAEGNRFDGIAEDLEREMTAQAIGTFSGLVRAYLGVPYLLVGVTYPPQSLPTYPFGVVSRYYNVVAPMDYWHQTKTAFGLNYGHAPYNQEYGRRYAVESISTIRRLSIPGTHIAPIGQVFDNYGHVGMGPHAPSAAELLGFLQGSKAEGAIGASFFQWMTATDPEWETIDRFRF